MDNITKKTFIQRCTEVAKYVLFILPILTDLIGIVSLLTPKLQSWLDTHLGGVSCIIIITIVNIVLLANIIFVIDKMATKKADKANEFIEGYDKLLEEYADYLSDFDSRFDEINSVDELYKIVAESLKTIIDRTKTIISNVTGFKVRVCIKSFPEKYTSLNLDTMELMTFCRSDKSLRDSILERNDRVKVKENTDFKLIMMETTAYPYFAFNGLKNFERTTGIPYENSTDKWDKKYVATIVYPISKHVDTKRGKEIFQILGFLCVDTLSEKAFSAAVGLMCIRFMSSLSHLLYVFLDKCILCRERIENIQSQNQQERECVNVE